MRVKDITPVAYFLQLSPQLLRFLTSPEIAPSGKDQDDTGAYEGPFHI